MSDGYPKSSVVLPGAILSYLVDCIMTAQNPPFSTITWEDNGFFRNAGRAVFGTNDGQGIYGAIIFEGKSLVGIFNDSNSKRNPYVCADTYDLNGFCQGMPARHRFLVASFIKDFDFVEHVDGRSIPAVTTAFWDDGEYLTAADPWDVVLAEGARVIRIELMQDVDQALAAWQEEYDMSPEQAAFVRSLFNSKMARWEGKIELSQAEAEWLRATSEEPNGEGIASCLGKLAAIGILVPLGKK